MTIVVNNISIVCKRGKRKTHNIAAVNTKSVVNVIGASREMYLPMTIPIIKEMATGRRGAISRCCRIPLSVPFHKLVFRDNRDIQLLCFFVFARGGGYIVVDKKTR